MVEMVIPGTYVEVRAEGLISAGRVATGIVGVVGTASSGPVGTPVTLSGYANAREIFGPLDEFNRPEDGSNPLTLVRALEHVYNNGASSVVAVRVSASSSSSATFAVRDASDNSVARLTALPPGTWGNNIQIAVAPAEDDCRIENETHDSAFDQLDYTTIVPSAENRIRVFRGITRQNQAVDIVYKRVVQGEEVSPDSSSRYFLSSIPVEQVANINQVQVLEEVMNEVIPAAADGIEQLLAASEEAP